MGVERKRKVARLLGLPIPDNAKDEFVYNKVDTILKQTEFKSGQFKGLATIEVFNRFADMKSQLLHIKDLVKQAISNCVIKNTNSHGINISSSADGLLITGSGYACDLERSCKDGCN